jgi:16S rRNA A1518/A1519 N6-dimethyltransferase RsmA/KsgA/DIM1 with predicted DNA glycosylase/AP lyase activity
MDLITKPQVDEILESLNLAPNLRAENLTVEQMFDLIEACRLKGKQNATA